MAANDGARCIHELLQPECAICREVLPARIERNSERKSGASPATAPPAVRRLAKALRAQRLGRHKSKAERRALAAEVRAAEAALTEPERRRARKLAQLAESK